MTGSDIREYIRKSNFPMKFWSADVGFEVKLPTYQGYHPAIGHEWTDRYMSLGFISIHSGWLTGRCPAATPISLFSG